MTKQIAQVYNTFGQYYHDSRNNAGGRVHNEYIDMPAALSLLPKRLRGLRVLDAGCGSGIYAQTLAKKGADVTGIDVSKKMIEIAEQETPSTLKVNYRVGNVTKLPYRSGSFEWILSMYVLENVKDLKKVFKEFFRVLRPGGSCIFSISHPTRAQITKIQKDGKEIWILENYFKQGLRQAYFSKKMIVPKFTRPLQDYTIAATQAGFLISALLEPQPLPEARKIDTEKFATAMRLPQIMTIKLFKP